jgi:hypothetical protein
MTRLRVALSKFARHLCLRSSGRRRNTLL